MLKHCWIRLVRLDNAQIYEAGLAILKKEPEDYDDPLSIETTHVASVAVSRPPTIQNNGMELLWLEQINKKDPPGVDPLFIKNENVGESFAILKPGLNTFRDASPLLENVIEQEVFSRNPIVQKEYVCCPQKPDCVRDQWWKTIKILKPNPKILRKRKGKKAGRVKRKECNIIYQCKLCLRSYKKDTSRLQEHSQSHSCWVTLKRSKDVEQKLKDLSGFQKKEMETNNIDNVREQKSDQCKEGSEMLNVVSSHNLLLDVTPQNVDRTENECWQVDISSEGLQSKICTACDRTFLDEKDLFCHQKIHNAYDKKSLVDRNKPCSDLDSGVHKFSCYICQKGFHFKGVLYKHFLVHTKPYACTLCAESFGTRNMLGKHCKEHHSIALDDRCKKNKNVQKHNDDKTEDLHKSLIERMPPLLLFERCKCSQCDRTFYTKSFLTEHFKSSHSSVRIYKCDSCGVCFEDRNKLIIHLQTVNPNFYVSINKCQYCVKTFSNQQMLRSHMIKCRQNHELRCDICGKKFYNKKSLILHILNHKAFKNVTTKMAYANAYAGANKQRRDLQAQYLANKAFHCVVCHAKFPKKFQLFAHVKIHTQMNRFVCEECGKLVKSQSDLFNHRLQHSQQNQNLVCEICGKSFKQSYNLISHKQNKHPEAVIRTEMDKKNLESSQCSKTFTRLIERQTLDRENGTDWSDANCQRLVYICETCGKKLTNFNALRLHLRVHGLITPYACQICRKTFMKRDGLARHKKLLHNHFTKCSACKKMFKGKEELKNHVVSEHPDFNWFRCKVCVEVFVSAEELTLHSTSHENQTNAIKQMFADHNNWSPYKCDICFQTFLDEVKLKNHVRGHKRKPVKVVKINATK